MSGGWGAQPEEASQPALKKDPEPSLRPGPVGPVPALGLWQRPVQVQVGDGSPPGPVGLDAPGPWQSCLQPHVRCGTVRSSSSWTSGYSGTKLVLESRTFGV